MDTINIGGSEHKGRRMFGGITFCLTISTFAQPHPFLQTTMYKSFSLGWLFQLICWLPQLHIPLLLN